MSNLSIQDVYVNRETEIDRFHMMLQGESQFHTMLIQAEAGMGKSSLLRKFWTLAEKEKICRARVDFKRMSHTVVEVLGDLCHDIGREQFNLFHSCCKEFARVSGINIDIGHSSLTNTQIDASMSKMLPEQRKAQRQILTDAFFEDLDAIHNRRNEPLLLIFDTHEKATDEVQEWLTGQFLARLRRYPWLLTVIAGQSIPYLDSSWAQDWCMEHSLKALDLEHVREYLQRVEIRFSSEETVVTLYRISAGKPYDLASHVEMLLKAKDEENE